jgi:hypothetical protein
MNFDAARPVADPTAQVVPLRQPIREGPKTHALDGSANADYARAT